MAFWREKIRLPLSLGRIAGTIQRAGAIGLKAPLGHLEDTQSKLKAVTADRPGGGLGGHPAVVQKSLELDS